jgi:transposase-like protein
MALARMKSTDNITALAAELGVERRLLYNWRDRAEPQERAEKPPPLSRETLLERENVRLKRVLAEKTLEVDFFRGALQQVEARRQLSSSESGAKASTPTSGQ